MRQVIYKKCVKGACKIEIPWIDQFYIKQNKINVQLIIDIKKIIRTLKD